MRSCGSSWLAISTLAIAAALSGACASSGAVPRPFPSPAGAAVQAPPHRENPPHPENPSNPEHPEHPANPEHLENTEHPANLDPYQVVGTALALRGIPYRNGGTDPQGFDCSGFTQYVFSRYGVPLPREVREQYRVGKAIRAEDLAPGDIVFFSTTAPGPSHVAIAIGGDQFVHAPSSTGVVRVEHLSSSYWSPRYLGARRVVN